MLFAVPSCVLLLAINMLWIVSDTAILTGFGHVGDGNNSDARPKPVLACHILSSCADLSRWYTLILWYISQNLHVWVLQKCMILLFFMLMYEYQQPWKGVCWCLWIFSAYTIPRTAGRCNSLHVPLLYAIWMQSICVAVWVSLLTSSCQKIALIHHSLLTHVVFFFLNIQATIQIYSHWMLNTTPWYDYFSITRYVLYIYHSSSSLATALVALWAMTSHSLSKDCWD